MVNNIKQINRQVHRRLMEALPADSELRTKLDLCGTDSLGYFYTCRQPACFHCRRRYVARQTKAALNRFAGCKRGDLSFLTVVFDPAYDVADIEGVVARARPTIRNIFAKHRRGSRRWRKAQLLGWIEVDALCGDDVPGLGSERAVLLDEMGVQLRPERPTYLPTLHAVVAHEGLDWQEIRDAFSEKWTAARQVHVRPLYGHQPVEKSIGCIVRYVMKRTCTTSLIGTKEIWPTSWLVEFETWTASWSRSFQSLKVSVGPSKETKTISTPSVTHVVIDSDYGVMPITF
jgi:hypothetical protein